MFLWSQREKSLWFLLLKSIDTPSGFSLYVTPYRLLVPPLCVGVRECKTCGHSAAPSLAYSPRAGWGALLHCVVFALLWSQGEELHLGQSEQNCHHMPLSLMQPNPSLEQSWENANEICETFTCFPSILHQGDVKVLLSLQWHPRPSCYRARH